MIASEGQAAGHGCQVPVPRCRSQARDQSREAEAKRKGSQVVGGCLAYTVCVRCRCIGASARSRAPRTASRRYSFFVQHRYGMPRGASLRASALRCNGFTPSLHLDLNMDRSGVSLLRSSRSAFRPCTRAGRPGTRDDLLPSRSQMRYGRGGVAQHTLSGDAAARGGGDDRD